MDISSHNGRSTGEAQGPPPILVYSEALSAYRFPDWHPLKPERFSLAVDLVRELGWVCEGATVSRCIRMVEPVPLDESELLLAHDQGLIDAVKLASTDVSADLSSWGIGPGDTPAVVGMHDAALAACSATATALDLVLDSGVTRAFSPAGGMHHAHRGSVAGFCIYNDAVVAIGRATRDHPGLRVAYVDIDVHHGDGVQEAFLERADVLTVSVHESGAYRYPGTGAMTDMGRGMGRGAALNVPLSPGAGPTEYRRVMELAVVPALRRFAPDLLVVQAGGDSHAWDPLATIDNTIRGYLETVRTLIGVAHDVCSAGVVLLGGGGYQPFDIVPRMWAGVVAELIGEVPPVLVPAGWVEASERAARERQATVAEHADRFFADEQWQPTVVDDTAAGALDRVIEALRRSHPLLAE